MDSRLRGNDSGIVRTHDVIPALRESMLTPPKRSKKQLVFSYIIADMQEGLS
jgi:hypothetical protein